MKQAEIQVGGSYLFGRTDVEHRKNMEGIIVTVIQKIKGKSKRFDYRQNGIPKSPMRFKLSNGQYANAANLLLSSNPDITQSSNT